MAAYVVVDIDVTNAIEYEEYKRLAAPSVAAYGGRYLVRGGKVELLEGDWRLHRFVVLEFASVSQAKAWWHSPEYRVAREIRARAAHTNMVVVEGV